MVPYHISFEDFVTMPAPDPARCTAEGWGVPVFLLEPSMPLGPRMIMLKSCEQKRCLKTSQVDLRVM
jgi:hypothetical protein